ncbi:MAG: hypothetical protein ACRDCD_01815 [Mycoplasmoidaceae bacterium]
MSESRVKRYKSYRKQIDREYTFLSKVNKDNKELLKLESKLKNIDSSLVAIEEVDLFSIDIVYDDNWSNYLVNLKEIISFYDLKQISKILLESQNPVKKIEPSNITHDDLIKSLLKNDLNYRDIKKIENEINFKKQNQEVFKREMKDVSNHIEQMVTESKKLRDDKPFIGKIKAYNNNDKRNQNMKKFYFVAIAFFFILFIIGIILFLIGGII